MIALPAYNIINFLDWVKNNPRSKGDIGFVRECVMRGKHTHTGFEDIIPFATQFIREKKIDIDPYHLVASLEFYLYSTDAKSYDKNEVEKALWYIDESEFEQSINADGNPVFMSFMLQSPPKMPLSLEVGFLQWIIEKKVPVIQIINMTSTAFEQMVDVFLSEQYGENYSKHLKAQLLNFFRIDHPKTFFDKMKNILLNGDAEKVNSIGYILDRFINPQIYKCMFLLLDSDKQFKKFINDYWINLHMLSGGWLDIYYSKNDLLICGYKIIDELKKLNPPLDALPCLALWKDSLIDARYIELRELDYKEEVYHIIQGIVENIRNGFTLDEIYKEAVKMADRKRTDHHPNIIQNITGPVVGPVIGINNGNVEVQTTNIVSKGEFERQLKEAIEKINDIEEMTLQQKKELIAIMYEAKSSVDETQQKICKNKFEAFMLQIGSVAFKVISVLSELSSIAQFFGFGNK